MRNTYIEITVTNFFNDITEPLTTKSWVVTVYTDDDKIIDQISKGLDFTYKCYWPCETCASNARPANPKKCSSCNHLPNQGLYKKILFENQCISDCPTDTFYDASRYTC